MQDVYGPSASSRLAFATAAVFKDLNSPPQWELGPRPSAECAFPVNWTRGATAECGRDTGWNRRSGEPIHSDRSAITGSILDARRAGAYPATSTAIAIVTIAAAIDDGSSALIP
jgi:hypothetical protein